MSWNHFCQSYLDNEALDLALDISKVPLPENFLADFAPKYKAAHEHMLALEKGAIANPDENRMVGHYWLRNSSLAPSKDLSVEIDDTVKSVQKFSASVLKGKVKGTGGSFKNLLLVGIGGSALGPQFIDQALRPAKKGLKAFFFDNTDPDGMDRVIGDLKGELDRTLVVVISKSGGTQETRNGMLEAQAAFKKAKVKFASHAVAVTGEGSRLFNTAESESWLKIFPMWDWVGGRTSVMSAVGLLPAALSGFDIEALLAGAAEMDEWTRDSKLETNPAALLSAMWYSIGEGKGLKDMVILPYKDRLELFSKYLQQLVMESLGKEKDLDGNVVNQGIAVYGNKGSTDQHAYIQQLRDGLNNFFATFIEVKRSRAKNSIQVDKNVTTGDFLEGFFLGTRQALHESDRSSMTITIGEVSARSVGQLIALFERAVGFYAHYVNINAYHQPGVEAGKKAAADILEIKLACVEALKKETKPLSALALAKKIGDAKAAETVFKLLNFLSANPKSGVALVKRSGAKSTFASSKS
jgi:glucose-6-phosphate isomerase